MIYLAILIGWCLLVAAHQAKDDAQAILANEPIFHVPKWLTRALMCGITAFAMAVASGHGFISFPLLLLVAYGSFNIPFRYWLNKRRGLPIDYVSESNAYDRLFIRHFGNGAGSAAYAVEFIVMVASTIIYLTL